MLNYKLFVYCPIEILIKWTVRWAPSSKHTSHWLIPVRWKKTRLMGYGY